jgi:hypothetical protein
MLRSVWLALALCLAFAPSARADFVPPWLTGESRPEDLVISLATFGPGDEVHQFFGHTALEVEDTRLGVTALYNFGVFGFDQAFLAKFLKGRLEFWLGVQPTKLSYQFYAEQDRDVRVMELDLTPYEAGRMAKALAVHALPENRTYLYHHYLDNCATRIVDAIDGATQGEFKKSLQAPARLDFRGHTRRYASRSPVLDWLLVFAMNDSMEQPIKRMHELFLPVELEDAVAAFQYKGKPFVRKKRILHEASVKRPVLDVPPTTWPYTLALGVALGGLLLGLGRLHARRGTWRTRVAYGWVQASFGLVFGLLGTLVAALAMFTEHQVTKYNENLFFASPLLLGLVVGGVALMLGKGWAGRMLRAVWVACAALALLGLALKVLPSFDQANALIWTLLLPAQLLGAAGWLAWLGRPGDVPATRTLATSGS